MTVAELIAALQALPQDALVLVDGFDSTDFDHCAAPTPVRVLPVEQTSHGPSFVEEGGWSVRHHHVTGNPIDAVYLGIGGS